MVTTLTNWFVRAIVFFKHTEQINKSIISMGCQTDNIRTNNALRYNKLGIVLKYKIVNKPQPETYTAANIIIILVSKR